MPVKVVLSSVLIVALGTSELVGRMGLAMTPQVFWEQECFLAVFVVAWIWALSFRNMVPQMMAAYRQWSCLYLLLSIRLNQVTYFRSLRVSYIGGSGWQSGSSHVKELAGCSDWLSCELDGVSFEIASDTATCGPPLLETSSVGV